MATNTALGISKPDATDTFAASVVSLQNAFNTIDTLITADRTSLGQRVLTTGGSTIQPSTASTAGLIIKGAASQTANLQEWQNSAGTVLANVTAVGAVIATSTNVSHQFGAGTIDSNSTLTVTGSNATATKLTVKGTASQTANLQEWQNSAGTVMSAISSIGRLYVVEAGVSNVTYTGFADGAAVGAVQGRLAILINGATRYIPYYL